MYHISVNWLCKSFVEKTSNDYKELNKVELEHVSQVCKQRRRGISRILVPNEKINHHHEMITGGPLVTFEQAIERIIKHQDE